MLLVHYVTYISLQKYLILAKVTFVTKRIKATYFSLYILPNDSNKEVYLGNICNVGS